MTILLMLLLTLSVSDYEAFYDRLLKAANTTPCDTVVVELTKLLEEQNFEEHEVTVNDCLPTYRHIEVMHHEVHSESSGLITTYRIQTWFVTGEENETQGNDNDS